MNMINSRILVLAPHTDDGELGCGATICKALRGGADVFYVAFSIAEDSVPDGYPKDILAQEVSHATASLGILGSNLIVKRYPVRHFPRFRQDILEDLVRLRNDLRPNTVFAPSSTDIHQDHQVIHDEAVRAFKTSNLLGYELPWNCRTFPATLHICVSEEDIKKKMAALAMYQTQAERVYMRPSFINGWAETRGVQAGFCYAEAFELLRGRIE